MEGALPPCLAVFFVAPSTNGCRMKSEDTTSVLIRRRLEQRVRRALRTEVSGIPASAIVWRSPTRNKWVTPHLAVQEAPGFLPSRQYRARGEGRLP